MRIDPDTCCDPHLLAAEVRRLQAIIDAMPGFTVSLCSESGAIGENDVPPQPRLSPSDSFSDAGKTPETGNVPPEWLQRPYWVDPPSGWLYGFPRLYDPATDGDMTEWIIANGYPEKRARRGLDCTFTAATEGDSIGTD